VAGALQASGPGNEAIVRQFLFSMISMEERGHAEALLPAEAAAVHDHTN
jgi:hypothetical protein